MTSSPVPYITWLTLKLNYTTENQKNNWQGSVMFQIRINFQLEPLTKPEENEHAAEIQELTFNLMVRTSFSTEC